MSVYKELSKIVGMHPAFLLSNVGVYFHKLLWFLALAWTEQARTEAILWPCLLNQQMRLVSSRLWHFYIWHGILFWLCVMDLEIIFPHHAHSKLYLEKCHFSFFHADLFWVDSPQDLQTFALWKRRTKCLTTRHSRVLPWCKCLHTAPQSTAFFSHPHRCCLYAVEFSRRDSWVLRHSQWNVKFLLISWFWKRVAHSQVT